MHVRTRRRHQRLRPCQVYRRRLGAAARTASTATAVVVEAAERMLTGRGENHNTHVCGFSIDFPASLLHAFESKYG